MERRKTKSRNYSKKKGFSWRKIFWKWRKDRLNLAHIPSQEEHRLESIKHERATDHDRQIKVAPADEQPEAYNLEDLKSTRMEPGKQVEILGQLIARNKITVSNAFEVTLVDVTELHEYQSRSEPNWKVLASAIQSNTLVYVHKAQFLEQQANRLLSEILRRRQNEKEPEVQILPRGFPMVAANAVDELERDFQLMPQCHRRSAESISVSNLEEAFDLNPFYEKSKRSFNQTALKSLLVNSLSTQRDLSLNLHMSEQAPTERPWYILNAVNYELERMRAGELGLKNMIKDMMEDVHQLCRQLIGTSYKDRYVEQSLDLYAVTEPVAAPFRSVNVGFDTWNDGGIVVEEQESNAPPLPQLFKYEPIKNEHLQTLLKIQAIGTGKLSEKWPLKQESSPEKLPTEPDMFAPYARIDRNALLKPRRNPTQAVDYSQLTQKCTLLIEHQAIDFNKSYYRRVDDENTYKAKLRIKQKKNYSDQQSLQRYQPIRKIKERVKRLPTIQQTPNSSAGPRTLNIEQCYSEYTKDQDLSLCRFFMTFLHLANESNLDIVSSS